MGTHNSPNMTGGSKENQSKQRDKQNRLRSVGELSAPDQEAETT